MSEKNNTSENLERGIDWKQGLAIAIGVPLLILPSIGDFTKYVWGFSIAVWMLSVFQGFMQNMAYGEMATMFPNASGLPGFSQSVFKSHTENKYDIGNFIGGFSAWSYWFAWNPILAIFSILIGSYLHELLPIFNSTSELTLSLSVGIIINSLLIFVNYKGLSSGAILGYVLAVISLAPVIIISISPFITKQFHFTNITEFWLPTTWQWDLSHIMMLFGVFAMAQWSACAWETASIYGPEYKNPKTDLPKALFSCGIACFLIFALVQTACIGTLGVDGILSAPLSPMLSLAKVTLGSTGAYISIFMLIAAMVLIIQTALLGSSRAMYSMALEGNLPKMFGKTNQYGTPVNAMISISLFNLFLICLRTPTAIIAAASIGYVFTNGISLFAYVKAKKDPRFSKLEPSFKAPKVWKNVSLVFGLLNIPFYLIGIVYLNWVQVGWTSTFVGFIVLAAYIPLWFYSQNQKYSEENLVNDDDDDLFSEEF
jgi:amino acid transporter